MLGKTRNSLPTPSQRPLIFITLLRLSDKSLLGNGLCANNVFRIVGVFVLFRSFCHFSPCIISSSADLFDFFLETCRAHEALLREVQELFLHEPQTDR